MDTNKNIKMYKIKTTEQIWLHIFIKIKILYVYVVL